MGQRFNFKLLTIETSAWTCTLCWHWQACCTADFYILHLIWLLLAYRHFPGAASIHFRPVYITAGRHTRQNRHGAHLMLISGWQSAASTFCICSIYPENTDDLLEIVSLLFVIVFCIFIPEMSRHAHTHSHRNRLQAAEKPSPQIIPQVYGLFAIHLLSDQFLLILLPPTGEKCSTQQDHFCLYLAAVFFVCMFQGLSFSCYTELQ